jgi:16S rRNA (cytosine1402-N4)-methyltransferase
MDQRQKLTAKRIVNSYNQAEIEEIVRSFGEQKNSSTIAKTIVENRPFCTAKELADLLSQKFYRHHKKIHPATQVFQSLRIAVNDELAQLEKALPLWIEMLNTGGRLGVISFHSLEDRLVKQAIKDYGGKRYDATLQSVTKRPLTASENEIVFNPRARSAKLRVAQRK